MADVEQSSEWEDFDAAARRPIEQHIRNSFIHTYKPVLDDAEYRSFETMEEYRHWCQENLPLSDSAGQDFDLDLDKHEENGQKVPAALLQIGFRLTT